MKTMSATEAAAALGCSRTQVHRMIRLHELPGAAKCGHLWRIPVAAVHLAKAGSWATPSPS